VWLYHQHGGTCSEHGWFANAAGRCALIPMTLNEASRFDHKWNMFYERGWKDFEPINGWINRMANDYWEDPSKILNGCFMWRGDGFIWGNTEQFTPVCTLNVVVLDNNSKPVDGALAIVDCPGRPGPFCLAGWTNSKGIVSFLLGDNIEYFSCAIQSVIGNVSAKNTISNSKGGMSILYTPKITASLPQLKIKVTSSPSNNNVALQKISYNIEAESEIVYGKHNYSFDNYSFSSTFSEIQKGGSIDFFVLDEENFLKYKEGKEAEALLFCKDTTKIKGEFSPMMEKVYFVISNEERCVVSSIAYVSFKMYSESNASIFYKKELQINSMNRVKIINGKEMIFILPSTCRGEVKLEVFKSNGVVVYRSSEILRDSEGKIFFKWGNLNITSGVYFYRILGGEKVTLDKGYFIR
ncbi:MAG: hypothetical protein N2053_12280, partial [Chitinispirillaceae bacterium]|nr:hypothetical protein [Chitinispirillaceae bacterium]